MSSNIIDIYFVGFGSIYDIKTINRPTYVNNKKCRGLNCNAIVHKNGHQQ